MLNLKRSRSSVISTILKLASWLVRGQYVAHPGALRIHTKAWTKMLTFDISRIRISQRQIANERNCTKTTHTNTRARATFRLWMATWACTEKKLHKYSTNVVEIINIDFRARRESGMSLGSSASSEQELPQVFKRLGCVFYVVLLMNFSGSSGLLSIDFDLAVHIPHTKWAHKKLRDKLTNFLSQREATHTEDAMRVFSSS